MKRFTERLDARTLAEGGSKRKARAEHSLLVTLAGEAHEIRNTDDEPS